MMHSDRTKNISIKLIHLDHNNTKTTDIFVISYGPEFYFASDLNSV